MRAVRFCYITFACNSDLSLSKFVDLLQQHLQQDLAPSRTAQQKGWYEEEEQDSVVCVCAWYVSCSSTGYKILSSLIRIPGNIISL